MKVYASESNVIAQEKALEAVLAFVENSSFANRIIGDVVTSIIQKCFTTRPKSKDLGMEIIMIGIEIEKQEIIIEELIKGTTNKTPKIVLASLQALKEAIKAFGPKIIQIKPIVKQIPLLLDHRDAAIREEGKDLVITIYQWLGDVIKPSLKSLKPIQLQELETEFDSITRSGIKMTPTRFLRSQQHKMAAIKDVDNGASLADAIDGTDEAEKEMDPYELVEPVDVLAKVTQPLYDKAQDKSWQARKETMEQLSKILDHPKYLNGDYGELIKLLRTIISKDTNIIVVTLAGDNLTKLAQGLRKKFSPYAPMSVNSILEKFKEKKSNVVTSLKNAIDAIYLTTVLESVSEEIVTFIGNKNPSVRFETIGFLCRCLQKCTPTLLNKKLVKLFTISLIVTMNDSDPTVRDVSAEALGIMMKIVGERVMTPLISDLEKLKIDKIKEYSDKFQGSPAAASTKAGTSSAVSKVGGPATKQRDEVKGVVREKAVVVATNVTEKKKQGAPIKKRIANKVIESENTTKTDHTSNVITNETPLSSEEALEKALEYIPPNILKDLSSNDWKERLAAIESTTQLVKKMEFNKDFPTQVIVHVVCKKPGLKETNFQVNRLKLDLLADLAARGKYNGSRADINFTKTSVEIFLPDLIEKLGDPKNGNTVCDVLSALCETSYGFREVGTEVLRLSFERKNPKLQSESLVWMSKAIRDFGLHPYFSASTIRPLIETAKTALAASNPAVRNAAVAFVTVLHVYGSAFRPSLAILSHFQDQKPALLQQLTSEVDKVKSEKPSAPTKGLVTMAPTDAGVGKDGTHPRTNGDSGEVCDREDDGPSYPRTNIGPLLEPAILLQLCDKDWKVRKEGITGALTLLEQYPHVTPDVGEFVTCLKSRIATESNKNLTPALLNVCEKLVEALGSKGASLFFGSLVPPTLHCMGDAKVTVRKAAAQTATAWLSKCSYIPFFESSVLVECLKQDNPFLRADLLTWMSETLLDHPSIKVSKIDVKPVVGEICGLVEDRNPEVRKAAIASLKPLVKLVGYEAMVRVAKASHPKSSLLVPLLEKVKQECPSICAGEHQHQQKVIRTSPKAQALGEVDALKYSDNSVSAKLKLDDDRKMVSVMPPKRLAPDNPLENPFLEKSLKENRFKDELAFKILRWNFLAPKPEYINQLRDLFEQSVNTALINLLFNKDVKYHIKALECLQAAIDRNYVGTLNCLDLILKWITLKFFETNTTLLLKCYEYLSLLNSALIRNSYMLHDIEGSSFLPYLINKSGDPKDVLRKQNKSLLRSIYQIYPASKVFPFLVDGVKSKNSKQRQDCLEEVEYLLSIYEVALCQGTLPHVLKVIAPYTNDRDNSVRVSAHNVLALFHSFIGDTLYKHLSHLSNKELTALEEKIKKGQKSQPAVGAGSQHQSPPSKAQQQSSSPHHLSHDFAASSLTKEFANQGPNPSSPPPSAQEIKVSPQKTMLRTISQTKNKYLNFDPKYGIPMSKGVISPPPALIDISAAEELMNRPVTFPKYERYTQPTLGTSNLNDGPNINSAAVSISPKIISLISQIASGNIEESNGALDGLEETIKYETVEVLIPCFDQLLISATAQLKILYNRHTPIILTLASSNVGDDVRTEPSEVRNFTHLYTHLLGLLTYSFGNSVLAKQATKDVLFDLILTCITSLIDPRLDELACGSVVCRKLNVILIKIIENSDATHVVSLLVKALHNAIQRSTDACASSDRFVQLIMKCLWKAIKLLNNLESGKLNIEKVLFECCAFMKAFPASFWKSKESDIPMRTIKTLVHSITKANGESVLKHLTFFRDQDEMKRSDLYAYMMKVLKIESKISNRLNQSEEVEADPVVPGSIKPFSELSQQAQDELSHIFLTIGARETTKQGLEMLYTFQVAHPEIDMEHKLSSTTPLFREYITKGLTQIAEKRGESFVNVRTEGSDVERALSHAPYPFPKTPKTEIPKLIKPQHMSAEEWHDVLTAKLTEHENLARHQPYFTARGSNLHSLEPTVIAQALADSLTYIERCREDFLMSQDKLTTNLT